MLRPIALLTLIGCLNAAASAAVTQFPYEGVVMGDDVYVRSGPGKNYYATGRLNRGERVVVHRHDPGGWFMIAPPPGSISWIAAAAVQRNGQQGIVAVPADESGQPGQAVVRIGSTLSDDHQYTGRQLSNGDEVQILGEKALQTDAGRVKMLQIVPPPREYRWVKGNFIVPVDESLREQLDNDPYAVPSSHRTPEKLAAIPGLEEPGDIAVASAPVGLPSLPAPSIAPGASPPNVALAAPLEAGFPQDPRAPKLRLMEIDRVYADRIEQDITQWGLGEVQAAYVALGQEAPELRTQIDGRLAALEGRLKLYNEYMKFVQLTSSTSQRDAALLGLQSGVVPADGTMPGDGLYPAIELGLPATSPPTLEASLQPDAGTLPAIPQLPPASARPLPPGMLSGMAAAPSEAAAWSEVLETGPGASPRVRTSPYPPQIRATELPPGALTQQPATPKQIPPQAAFPAQQPGAQAAAPPPRFDGAGILQTTNSRTPGVPRFMLIAPDGRFLAFADSQEVDLSPYVGQSLGLFGQRERNAQLQADYIQVRQAQPVQLVR
ncbi:MAG: SH3 domain-containing protein [Planctomyces sp.]|nr:SH3 domain-containing protein [Planctomyces sp.]